MSAEFEELLVAAGERFFDDLKTDREIGDSLAASPAFELLLAALDNDPLGVPFKSSEVMWFSFSSGLALGVHKHSLPVALLVTAALRLRRSDETFTLSAYAAEVCATTGRLRELIRGERVRLPAFVHFGGIEFEPDVTVNLPWGTLRRPGQGWPDPYGLDPHRAGDVVLQTEVEVALAVHAQDEPITDFFFDSFRELERLETMTIAACAVGIRERFPAPVAIWNMISSPLEGIGSSTLGGRPRPMYGTQAWVGADNRSELEEAGALVSKRYEPKLDAALRRLASATHWRFDPADALVDAVIALESLFGEDAELTFRISAAVAWLLIPGDRGRRVALWKEVKELYGRRSRIVHGRPSDPGDQERQRRATSLALECVRVLYRDHPELLSADDRATRLILQNIAA